MKKAQRKFPQNYESVGPTRHPGQLRTCANIQTERRFAWTPHRVGSRRNCTQVSSLSFHPWTCLGIPSRRKARTNVMPIQGSHERTWFTALKLRGEFAGGGRSVEALLNLPGVQHRCALCLTPSLHAHKVLAARHLARPNFSSFWTSVWV
jgi:hypothetical protein